MDYSDIRQQVYTHVIKAVDVGLIRLSAGNVSARTADGLVAITPSAIPYDQLTPEQISIITLQGEMVDGPPPSSEIALHTALLRARPDIGAVFHTHSPYAMTFSVLGMDIPVTLTEILVCGGAIPVAEWVSPGSPHAGEVALATFEQHPGLKALLLRNHGGLTIGSDLTNAFKLAYNLEIGAQVYYQALKIGTPHVLTEAQIQEVREIYGMKS